MKPPNPDILTIITIAALTTASNATGTTSGVIMAVRAG